VAGFLEQPFFTGMSTSGARRTRLHLAADPEIAALYGDRVVPLFVRGPIGRVDDTIKSADQLIEAMKEAKKLGLPGVRFTRMLDRGRLGPQEQVVLSDLSAARLPWARFDPKRLGERDWLAGGAGVLAGGAALRAALADRLNTDA